MGQRRNAGEHISPDEVASRAFPSAFRGISETDVRSYLRRVADELRRNRDRETELTQRVADLEATLRNPVPLTEQQLLDSLGEETARVLRSAQGAAEEIRARAEERAAQLVREAQEESTRVRAAADRVLTERTSAAEATAADIRRDAEERAAGMINVAEARAATLVQDAEDEARRTREDATATATSELELAREEGRATLAEAKALRERVLADLSKRRDSLGAQIAELHTGRDQLIEAFRTVKRAYSDAVGALSRLEKAAPATLEHTGETIPDAEPADTSQVTPDSAVPDAIAVVPTPVAETEPPAPVEIVAVVTEVVVPVETTEADAPEAVAVTDAEPAPDEPAIDDEAPDVDALFARLRAERTVTVETDEVEIETADGVETVDVTVVTETIDVDLTVDAPPAADESVADEAPGDDADAVAEAPAAELTGDARILAARDAGIEPAIAPLARAVKGRLQDEQNEVLDAVRKQKRKLSVEKSMPEYDAHRSAWADVLAGPVQTAFSAGVGAVGGQADMPVDLTVDLAEWIMLPLRERLESTIAESIAPGADLDTSDLPARIGARYREFRNQDLEGGVEEVLGAAYARGVAAGVPSGTVLRWIPTNPGTCSDCDDNVLEPTVVGEAFPTGQAWPPAHPGCRCVLAPVDDALLVAFAAASGAGA